MATQVNEEKVLVTIECISDVRKHPNADKLVIARVQGYDVIINPEEFHCANDFQKLVGQCGVFFEIDSLIPENLATLECFSYLKDRRVKTIRLRGEISQGLFLNFHNFHDTIEISTYPVGFNLTNILGVKKYYSPYDPEGNCYNPYLGNKRVKKHSNKANNSNPCLQPFPSFIPKTDEDKLQKNLWYLSKIKNRQIVCTLKLDGQSATFFNSSSGSGMCSRNFLLNLPDEKESTDGKSDSEATKEISKEHINFININKKYNILEKLKLFELQGIAIQGELYGPGINKNRMKAREVDFAVFNIFNFDVEKNTGKYLPHNKVIDICKKLKLPHVPVLDITPEDISSLDNLVKYASKQTYSSCQENEKILAEGVVIKTCDSLSDEPYISFKVISPLYLAEHGL